MVSKHQGCDVSCGMPLIKMAPLCYCINVLSESSWYRSLGDPISLFRGVLQPALIPLFTSFPISPSPSNFFCNHNVYFSLVSDSGCLWTKLADKDSQAYLKDIRMYICWALVANLVQVLQCRSGCLAMVCNNIFYGQPISSVASLYYCIMLPCL